MLDLITSHPGFMAAYNRFQAVPLAEAFRDIRTKGNTDASFTGREPGDWRRIRPQQFHHQTISRGLSARMTVQFPYVVQCDILVGGYATVDDKV